MTELNRKLDIIPLRCILRNGWKKTEAIGIISKGGRYGDSFAHIDIAFEFASWISAEFKMYVIQDYKRLKSDEDSKL